MFVTFRSEDEDDYERAHFEKWWSSNLMRKLSTEISYWYSSSFSDLKAPKVLFVNQAPREPELQNARPLTASINLLLHCSRG